ncbi:hypothetical protein P4O66_006624, partial [Electrophorus voltai]
GNGWQAAPALYTNLASLQQGETSGTAPATPEYFYSIHDLVFLKVQKEFCTIAAGSQVTQPWSGHFTSAAECVHGLLFSVTGVRMEDRMDLPEEFHSSVIEAVYDELLRRIKARKNVNVTQAFISGGLVLGGALSFVNVIQKKDMAHFLYCPSTDGPGSAKPTT